MCRPPSTSERPRVRTAFLIAAGLPGRKFVGAAASVIWLSAKCARAALFSSSPRLSMESRAVERLST